jgi:hypothetical protein
LAYTDVYAEMLSEENTVPWLKSTSSEQGVKYQLSLPKKNNFLDPGVQNSFNSSV